MGAQAITPSRAALLALVNNSDDDGAGLPLWAEAVTRFRAGVVA